MGRFTRRILMFLLAVMLASPVIIAAPPAKAGINHCAGIWANNNRVVVQHLSRCGPNGVYHIHVWGGGHSNNTRNYLYTGRLREFTARWPAAEGSKICAELWYHEGSGRYSSWGLPCDNM